MKKKKGLIVGTIISIIVFVIFIDSLGYLSFIKGSNEMRCYKGSGNNFDCYMAGGNVEVEYSGERIQLNMKEPDWIGAYCQMLDRVMGGKNLCGEIPHAKVYVSPKLAPLGDQFIIMKGTWEKRINPSVTETGTFETYGICKLETCYIHDPYPNLPYILKASSTTIYFKQGGYTESDACSEFNVGCAKPEPSLSKINVYRFKNNQCSFISILETERTIDDYDSLNECENKIVEIVPTPEPPEDSPPILEEPILEPVPTTNLVLIISIIIAIIIGLSILYKKVLK